MEIIEETIQETSVQVIHILKAIHWQKFHDLCLSIGNELNDHQWRFLKAVFLENAVAVFSNNMLTYVGDKEKGCDFKITSLDNLKIEMKYIEGCLFTMKNKKLTLRDKTKQITLLNSKGTNTHSKLPEHYADYLLIVEMNAAALILKENLHQYVTSNGDSLSATIPTDKLHIIYQPDDIIIMTEKKNLHIKETFMNTIIRIIQLFE